MDRAGNSDVKSVDITVDTSFPSPTGPYGGLPLVGIIAVVAGAIVAGLVLALRRSRAGRPD